MSYTRYQKTYPCECKRCRFKWNARIPRPRACTRCKSYFWQTASSR